MGGVNGLIVLADADKDKAVDCIVNGAFFAAGQRCTATSRIIVEEAVADDLAQRLIARIADLPMGDPRAPGTAIGPLVSLRSEEHTSELQSLMRISYAVFCLKKKKKIK